MPTNDGKWYSYHSIRQRRESWGESGYKAVFAPWAFWMMVYTPVFFGALRYNQWIWMRALGLKGNDLKRKLTEEDLKDD
jgi:hypothetical protein